jgi:hypothetical protein
MKRFLWHSGTIALALIGLVNLTDQRITWADVINKPVEKYATLRTELFDWVHHWIPLDIPAEWHNTILLLGVVFSVSNVGYRRRTGKVFVVQTLMLLPRLFTPISAILKEGPKWYQKSDYHPIDPSLPFAEKLDQTSFIFTEVCFSSVVILFGVEHLYEFLVANFPVTNRLDVIATKILQGHTKLALVLFLALFMGAAGAAIAWRWILTTALLFTVLVVANYYYVQWLAVAAIGMTDVCMHMA